MSRIDRAIPVEASVPQAQERMSWLPVPSDFRAGLRAAIEAPHTVDRLEALAALSQHQLSYLETIQLEQALRKASVHDVPGFPTIRLALLASATVDHLVPAIRVAGLRRRLLVEVHVGAYGQYRQELLDASSSLHRFGPHVAVFSLTAREAISGLPLTASAEEVDASLGASVDDLRNLWRKARETLGAALIQQTFLNFADPLFGSHDRLVPGAPARLIARLNDRVSEAAGIDGVPLLDVERASARDGLAAWFDPTRWLQAKFEIAPQAAAPYGELLARIIAAQRGLSRKCLVLDLDNTLWGGVVGDDGLEGIVLGEGSAAGEAHLALQRYAKHLSERGVILAVCSKNDPAIAEAVFSDHREMLLKRSDIAAFVANWNDKAANLELIADQLNIGVDSLVFVDDNPVERARVRESLPLVAVPELPSDAAHYVRCLADAGYFEAIAFTNEDRQRATQYAENTSREACRRSSQSLDDFIRGLEMSVDIAEFTPVDIARIAQLINKTNQFNPTTRRHSVDVVERFAAAADCITLQFRLLDRFGDNGLVSAMILRPDADATDILEIDTWVMSCRVFGRQLEFEAMNAAVEAALQRGARALRADYVPTPKNGVVSELYPSLGFTLAPEKAPDSTTTRWLLCLADYVARESHITRCSK